MSARRGFTLVEVLVGASILSLVVGAALGIWNLAIRSQSATQMSEALQAALLIEEHIEADMGRLVQVAQSPVRFWPDAPGSLAFYVHDPQGGQGSQLALRGVRYSHAGAGTPLLRECAGQREAVGTLPLQSIRFDPMLCPTGPVVRVVLEVARAPGETRGAPIVHAFLARMPAPRALSELQWTLLSGFPAEADAPGDQALPTP